MADKFKPETWREDIEISRLNSRAYPSFTDFIGRPSESAFPDFFHLLCALRLPLLLYNSHSIRRVVSTDIKTKLGSCYTLYPSETTLRLY